MSLEEQLAPTNMKDVTNLQECKLLWKGYMFAKCRRVLGRVGNIECITKEHS